MSTHPFSDNTWQRLAFEPIPHSQGKTYWLCVETDGSPQAIGLWANHEVQIHCKIGNEYQNEAVCFRTHYTENSAYILDPWLFPEQDSRFEVTEESQAEIHKILKYCIQTKDLYFLRLAHLADGFGKAQGQVSSVLSIGCGMAFQEAFLAARFPDIQILATDLTQTWNAYPFPNLSFRRKDILEWAETGSYDFVFSIETLEHIQDYRLAFKHMANKVKPGKYLYVSLPFASAAEQQDPVLRENEWRAYGHHLPGFTFKDLEDLFIENGFTIFHASNMFGVTLTHNINQLLSKLDSAAIESSLAEIARLFLMDVNDQKIKSRVEAVGIRMLGQRL